MRWSAQPLRKATAMLGNRAGMAESLERQLLRWRLRLSPPARPAPPSGSTAEADRR